MGSVHAILCNMWKEVKDFEGLYLISDGGKIQSLHKWRGAEPKLKEPYLGKRGYYVVDLSKKQYRKNAKVHRLVAQAFIPNPDNKPQVNHIDGNKLNNNVSNLEWCTDKENKQHARKSGLSADYDYKNAPKLTEDIARQIKYAEGYHREIAVRFNVGVSTVTHIKRGSRWNHV